MFRWTFVAVIAALALPTAVSAAPARLAPQVLHSGAHLGDVRIGVSPQDEALAVMSVDNGESDPRLVSRVRSGDGRLATPQELSRTSNAELPADIVFNQSGTAFLSWGVATTDAPGEHAFRPRGGLFSVPVAWPEGSCTRNSSVRFLPTGMPQVACSAKNGTAPNDSAVITMDGSVPTGTSFNIFSRLQPGLDLPDLRPLLDVGPDGTRAVAWVTSEGSGLLQNMQIKLSVAPAGGSFGAPQQLAGVLTSTGGWAVLSDIAVLADGRVAVVLSRSDGVTATVRIAVRSTGGSITDAVIPGATEGREAIERDGTGALVYWTQNTGFATPTTLKVASLATGASLGTAQTLDRDAPLLNPKTMRVASNGAAMISRIVASGGSSMSAAAWVRSARGRPFEGPFTFATASFMSGFDASIDRFGSVAAAWTADTPTVDTVFLGGLDAAGPVLSSLSIPGRLRAGRSGSFGVRAVDPAGVKSVRWSFGDRGSANGTGARHSYRRTGRYRATVVATDKAGKQSRASRVVTVVR